MKQRDETFTFMIVPHSGKTTYSISIPTFVIKAVAYILISAVFVVFIFAVHFSFSYKKAKANVNKLSSKIQDINTSKSQNLEDIKKLQQELDYFVKKTEALEEKMQGLEKLDNDLRNLLKDDPVLKKNVDKSTRLESRPRTFLATRGSIDREKAIKELKKLERKLPEQEESLKQLKNAIVKRNELISLTPTIKPVEGRITSKFGYRKSPFGSRREFHNGLDIAAPTGTPIKAAADGVVEYAGYIRGYGKIVTIRHGYGYETSYGHCSKILVKVGQKVKKGQEIAHVGNTGRSTGPHVHYMVKCNGVLEDPIDFIVQ